jgi:putative holliday junction resolvase
MRILAIDYGTVRVGLAMCDELEIVVTPFRVLPYSRQLPEEIARITGEQNVQQVIIGMPYALNGGETEMTRRVHAFAVKLRAALSCPVVEWDESYSSHKATQRMVESGMKKKKRQEKGTVDAWAAAIILQDYLAAREG